MTTSIDFGKWLIPIDFIVDIDSEENLLKEELILDSDILELTKQKSILELNITDLYLDLNSKFPTEIKFLHKLNDEYNQLLLDKAASQEIENKDSDESNDHNTEDLLIEEDTKSLKTKRKKKKRAELEDLYRKICMKTHPDRTNNKDLHILYTDAIKAYKNKNLKLLKLIWKALKSRSSLKDMLRLRIEEKEREKQALIDQINEFLNSDDYKMLCAYNNLPTKFMVINHYHINILQKIRALFQMINMIDPARYPNGVEIVL